MCTKHFCGLNKSLFKSYKFCNLHHNEKKSTEPAQGVTTVYNKNCPLRGGIYPPRGPNISRGNIYGGHWPPHWLTF